MRSYGKNRLLDSAQCIARFCGVAGRFVYPLVYCQIELYLYHRAGDAPQCGGQRLPDHVCRGGCRTNLFGYRVYHDKVLRIPLSELRTKTSYDEETYGMILIDPQSLQNAISVRCTDIKIVSIGEVPALKNFVE